MESDMSDQYVGRDLSLLGKAVYAINDTVSNKDIELIKKANGLFEYITVAIPVVQNREDPTFTGNISKARLGLLGVLGVSFDFYEQGNLQEFLEKRRAVSWVVQRGFPAGIVSEVNFPKYFIN